MKAKEFDMMTERNECFENLERRPLDSRVEMGLSLDRTKRPKDPLHVLIVEDDLDLYMVIETVLQGIDPSVRIDWATSAETAAVQLRESGRRRFGYDLIVADIFLNGEGTGVDLWNQCHDICPEVPMIIMSSLPPHKYEAMLGQQAISPPYLAKPFKLQECKMLFREMLKYAQKNRRFHFTDMRSSA
jgi:DNA-binding NtrC family response regulator